MIDMGDHESAIEICKSYKEKNLSNELNYLIMIQLATLYIHLQQNKLALKELNECNEMAERNLNEFHRNLWNAEIMRARLLS